MPFEPNHLPTPRWATRWANCPEPDWQQLWNISYAKATGRTMRLRHADAEDVANDTIVKLLEWADRRCENDPHFTGPRSWEALTRYVTPQRYATTYKKRRYEDPLEFIDAVYEDLQSQTQVNFESDQFTATCYDAITLQQHRDLQRSRHNETTTGETDEPRFYRSEASNRAPGVEETAVGSILRERAFSMIIARLAEHTPSRCPLCAADGRDCPDQNEIRRLVASYVNLFSNALDEAENFSLIDERNIRLAVAAGLENSTDVTSIAGLQFHADITDAATASAKRWFRRGPAVCAAFLIAEAFEQAASFLASNHPQLATNSVHRLVLNTAKRVRRDRTTWTINQEQSMNTWATQHNLEWRPAAA